MELNRNYCMLLGQLLFLSVVGSEDRLSEGACAAVAAVTHFIWLAAFAWTGKYRHGSMKTSVVEVFRD